MEYVTTETPMHADDVTLLPVVRVCHRTDKNTSGYWLTANKEPLAIIVCDSNGVRALTMASTEIAIDFLLQKIPGLDAILKPYWKDK